MRNIPYTYISKTTEYQKSYLLTTNKNKDFLNIQNYNIYLFNFYRFICFQAILKIYI